MRPALRLLGIAGAVLLLLGPAIAGAGALNYANTLNQSIHCTSGCFGYGRAIANATEEAILLDGVGLAVGGAGLGLVLLAAMSTMAEARREPRYPSSP